MKPDTPLSGNQVYELRQRALFLSGLVSFKGGVPPSGRAAVGTPAPSALNLTELRRLSLDQAGAPVHGHVDVRLPEPVFPWTSGSSVATASTRAVQDDV